MPAAGVPLSVPVPLRLSTNVTPLGSAPTLSAGVGVPTVVTVKLPGDGQGERRRRGARERGRAVHREREGLRARSAPTPFVAVN